MNKSRERIGRGSSGVYNEEASSPEDGNSGGKTYALNKHFAFFFLEANLFNTVSLDIPLHSLY